jgi:hypothetical protein
MTEQKRDWTARELAKAASVNESRIRQLLLKGKIKGDKRAGVWFIPDTEAQRWLASRSPRQDSTPE